MSSKTRKRRGYASLHVMGDYVWIATGTKAGLGHMQIRLKEDSKACHYFSALGRKRG